MLITSVVLSNIKSYREARIEFQPGTNAISGENGAGKSTIIEAIGYALFDYNPYRKIENMIRHGETKGTMEVHFTGEDERRYQVVRSIRRKGGSAAYYLRDNLAGTKLADAGVDGKEGVLKAIRDHLLGSVPGGAAVDLPKLFNDVIGVAQGTIMAPFLETPAGRKTTFDPILGIEEFTRAQERARDVVKVIETTCGRLEREDAKLEGELTPLPDRIRELASLSERIETLEREVETVRIEFARVEQRRSELEGLERGIQEITLELKGLTGSLEGLRSMEESTMASLGSARRARAVVTESEPHHRAYLALEKERADLERKRSERDTLGNEEQTLKLREVKLRTALERLDEEISEAERELGSLPDLEGKVAQQGDLERRLNELENRLTRRKENSRHLERLREDRARNAISLAEIRSRIAGMKELEERVARLDGLRKERGSLDTRAAELKSALDHIRKSRCALESGTCPYFREPCPRITGTPSRLFGEEERELRTELGQIRERAGELDGAIRECVTAGEELGGMRELVGRVTALEEAIAGSDRDIADLERRIGEGPSPTEADALREERTALGDHRGELQRVRKVREGLPVLTRRREDGARELATSEARSRELALRLAAFDGLDQDRQRIDIERDRHRPGYESFQRHEQEAARVERIGEDLEGVRATMAALREKIGSVERRLHELEGSFHPEELRDARARYDLLNGRIGSLEGRIGDHREQWEKLEEERVRLESLLLEKENVERRLRVERFSLRLMEHIREVFRLAPDSLRKRYVEAISVDANTHFHELMGDNTLDLTWDESYGITMRSGRDVIEFQLLSGGQQMSAALAVRMALIRRFSGLRIAFFDEPTHNLDGERRDNLARAFYRITGFDQLFVISHDETFNTVIENTIAIGNRNGESMVLG